MKQSFFAFNGGLLDIWISDIHTRLRRVQGNDGNKDNTHEQSSKRILAQQIIEELGGQKHAICSDLILWFLKELSTDGKDRE